MKYENDEAPSGPAESGDGLEAVRVLQAELRALPELDAPAGLWSAIEGRLVAGGVARAPARVRARRAWLGRAAWRAAALAAIFVLGLGVGRMIDTVESGPDALQLVSDESAATTLSEALAEVQRHGAQYDAALQQLQHLAALEAGASVPSLAEERLAALDLLVEASRTALAAEPADANLNAYLFAALEQRDNVIRELSARRQGSNSEAAWK